MDRRSLTFRSPFVNLPGLLQTVQDWGVISLAVILSLAIFAMPNTVSAAPEGIDIDTLPYPKAECISGVDNGACYVAEARLANGTMFVFSIDNSMLHRDSPEPTQTQSQANSVSNSNDDNNDDEAAEDSGRPPSDLPYCDLIDMGPGESCFDRKDFDEETGLYPCKDGSDVEDWRNCNGSNNDDSAAEDEPAQDGGCQSEDTYCNADENCRSESVDCIDDRNFDEDDYNG